jgi:hypothetical protein
METPGQESGQVSLREQKQDWCTDLGGRRTTLAAGRKNRKQAAEKLKALLAEQELLWTVGGSITVARL